MDQPELQGDERSKYPALMISYADEKSNAISLSPMLVRCGTRVVMREELMAGDGGML